MLIMIHGTKDLWVVCTDITVLTVGLGEDLISSRDANGWIGVKLLYIPADGTVKRDSIPH